MYLFICPYTVQLSPLDFTQSYSFYIFRLQNTYLPVPGPATISSRDIYNNYLAFTSAAAVKPLYIGKIGILIKRLFPSVHVIRAVKGVKYEGLRINFTENKVVGHDFYKPEAKRFGYTTLESSAESSKFCLFTGFQVNGNEVLKLLKLNIDGSWELRVRGILINPALVGLRGIRADNLFALKTILNTVKQLNLCKGKIILSQKEKNQNCAFQEWTVKGNENTSTRRASSALCHGVTSLLHADDGELCYNCQKLKLSTPTPKSRVNQAQDADTLISKLFPNADDLMIKFLKVQSDICHKTTDNIDSRSRRWDKDIIQVALSLWNRSPQGYTTLRNSNMFQLPSESLLQRYKNCFTQHPGLNENMLSWMCKEAIRFKSDRHGGIILDEMAVQEDLKMSFGDGQISLDGLVDLGPTSAHMNLLNTHSNDIQLASHVLQFVYLGYDGFRFPFAYYPTTGANAPEMYIVMWDAISKLITYEFTIDYVSFDGASNNRTLQMMHFEDKTDAYEKNFTTVNPFQPTEKVTMIMDYSHNIKKWRNNIFSSGDTEYSTRKLQYFSKYIVWEHWIKAYNWDRIHNAVRVHPRLTDEHIFLNKTSKMRNHLAEDVLDAEMLHLMKMYQQSLKHGDHLDATVSMLQKTSILVKIFRDPRPIGDINDERLLQLQEVETWLDSWEDNVNSMENVKAGEKSKMLMSHETVSDVHSMIKGFSEVCRRRVLEQKRSLVPAGLNSDIVENFFCQQRTICHGSNSNPSVHQYKYGITATVLGQNAVSKKSNAGTKSKHAIQPFCFSAPVTLAKKKCVRL